MTGNLKKVCHEQESNTVDYKEGVPALAFQRAYPHKRSVVARLLAVCYGLPFFGNSNINKALHDNLICQVNE